MTDFCQEKRGSGKKEKMEDNQVREGKKKKPQVNTNYDQM